MQELKQQIKDKKIEGIFLFYGKEKYIMDTYLDKAVEIALNGVEKLMNYDYFVSSSMDIHKIVNSIEILPFFSDKRVVVIREYGFFKAKQAKKTEILLEAIKNIPSTTVLFIIEGDIDKRAKLYKTINKVGKVVEFKSLEEAELIKYIARVLGKYHKKIDRMTAKYFIEAVGYDLSSIHNELNKLISYEEANDIITMEAIDTICTKSVENKIFELVDCMGSSRRDRALKLYHDLIVTKEPPTRILFMIIRQFRLNLQTKLLLEQKMNRKIIASKIKVPPFVANKCINQAKNFSVAQLKGALKECLDLEIKMKTGKIDIVTGIELIIIEYSKTNRTLQNNR